MGISAADHMSLRDRKAFALRNAFVLAVQNSTGTISDIKREQLSKRIGELVDDETRADASDERPADGFLREALEKIERYSNAFALDQDYSSMAEAIFLLNAELGKVDCGTCGGGRVCCGDAIDDKIVAERAAYCIICLKTAMTEAITMAKDFYASHAKMPLPEVELILSTKAIDGPCGQIPGDTMAINGETHYDDTATEKSSKILISLDPALWDRRSASALLYVVLHEVICHGFQMAFAVGPRERKSGLADPVSEGMVDALAVDLLDKRRDLAVEQGNAAYGEYDANSRTAREIHLARGSRDRAKPLPESAQVLLGAQCLDLVTSLYRLDYGNLELARGDAAKLVAELNLHPWGFAQRLKGASRLLAGLRSKSRDAALVSALLNFRRNRDVQPIIDLLTNL